MTKRQKFFSALGRFFKNFFTKNIVLKIVVVLFAILLWGFVIAEENPEYTKRIYGVEIDLLNEDSLQAKGWMLIDISADATDVDVKCEIKKHGSLDAAQVDCYVDLAKVAAASSADEDTVTIPLDVKYEIATEYGTIENVTVERVDVTLAKTQTLNNQTVEIETTGALPDGLIIDSLGSLTIASLTGRQDEISRIGKMKVTLDLSTITEPGIKDYNLPIEFYESGSDTPFRLTTGDGNVITTGLRVTTRAYKEVPIVVNVVPSETFNQKFEYEQQLIGTGVIGLCADKTETLDAITQVETEAIVPRLVKAEETRTCSLVLPEGTTLKNGQSRATVSVILTVRDKEISEVFTLPITYSETRDSVCLSGEEQKTVTIKVSGTYNAMQAFNRNWFTASVSIENYLQGTLRLPVRITFTGDPEQYDYTLVDPSDGFVEIVLLAVSETDAQNSTP